MALYFHYTVLFPAKKSNFPSCTRTQPPVLPLPFILGLHLPVVILKNIGIKQ